MIFFLYCCNIRDFIKMGLSTVGFLLPPRLLTMQWSLYIVRLAVGLGYGSFSSKLITRHDFFLSFCLFFLNSWHVLWDTLVYGTTFLLYLTSHLRRRSRCRSLLPSKRKYSFSSVFFHNATLSRVKAAVASCFLCFRYARLFDQSFWLSFSFVYPRIMASLIECHFVNNYRGCDGYYVRDCKAEVIRKGDTFVNKNKWIRHAFLLYTQ